MRNNAHNAATKNIKKKKIFVLCAGEVSEVSIDKHGNHPINNRRTGNCPEWANLLIPIRKSIDNEIKIETKLSCLVEEPSIQRSVY